MVGWKVGDGETGGGWPSSMEGDDWAVDARVRMGCWSLPNSVMGGMVRRVGWGVRRGRTAAMAEIPGGCRGILG